MKKPLELALEYLEIFVGNKPLSELSDILDEQCSFQGPMYQFNSAVAYINSLESDPALNASYDIIASFEDNSSACIIYQFKKPGIDTAMSQTFKIRNGKIVEILLIFDASVFR